MADSASTPSPLVGRPPQSGSGRLRSARRTPWRERRYTPYQKSAVSRNLKTPKSTHHLRRTGTPAQTRNDTRQLKEFTDKTWRVYRVSPLYGFSYAPQHLKQYASSLSVALHTKVNQAAVDELNAAERPDHATLQVFSGLKVKESDPEAVQIELRQKNGKGGAKVKTLITAVLCCVQAHQDVAASIQEGFTLLPALLVRGPVALTRVLHQWLQEQFDCCVSNAQFSPLALSWMVAMWAGCVKEKSSKKVELYYCLPSEVPDLRSIVMNIAAHSCKQLWDSIHLEQQDTFHEEEVIAFIKALEAHFYHHFKIKLESIPLTRIGTSAAYVSSDGRLKMYSVAHVQQVLGHITDVLLEQSLHF